MSDNSETADAYILQHSLHIVLESMLSDTVRDRPTNIKLYIAGWLKRHLRSFDGDALASPKIDRDSIAPPRRSLSQESEAFETSPSQILQDPVKAQRGARKRTVTMIKKDNIDAVPVQATPPTPLQPTPPTPLQPPTPSAQLPTNSLGTSIVTDIEIKGRIFRNEVPQEEPEERTSCGSDGACGCDLGHITKDYRGSDFSSYSCQTSFNKCVVCDQHPADRMCLCCLQAVCFKHTAQHYAANPNCTLYLNYEHLATNYKKAFWCEKCGTHTWAYIDAYESFTDQMAVTKGTYLLEPSLDKYFRSLEGSRFVATASSMQGWRSGQEDAECLIDCGNSSYLFGVFDGHGGAAVARYTSRELPQDIIARKRNGEGYEDLFKGAFVAVDSKMQQAGPDDLECNTTGCTGCVVYYDTAASTIVCANAGDSRAVICTAGGKAQDLSDDHKIYNTTEESRIKAAGYKIVDGRVEGMLAVPRAFGDFDFKGLKAGPELQAVSVVPDVKVQPLSGTEEFIIIACDGIWDVVSSQQAVDFVRRKLAQGIKAESTVALLLDRCMSSEITEDGVGTDNMSIILIQLQRGDS